jgi:formate--tetrahydrofolate ligase
LYEDAEPLKQKIEKIAFEVYGAERVSFSPKASRKIRDIEANPQTRDFGCCMAKTQYSLSDNPDLKGRPKGWNLYIGDVLLYQGAGFVVPVAGDIKLMPGTASDPAYRRIDIDTETGRVQGLF